MGNQLNGGNGEFQVNPNTHPNHIPPVPPPLPEQDEDVFISHGGETTFYLDQNESIIEERLEELAAKLDVIIPSYYLMELNQAS